MTPKNFRIIAAADGISKKILGCKHCIFTTTSHPGMMQHIKRKHKDIEKQTKLIGRVNVKKL